MQMKKKNILIEADSIEFSWNDGRKIFDDFNFSLCRGEKTAIMGDTGCGKSTFLKIVMGLIRPQRGNIQLFGKRMKSERDFISIRTRIGFLFQNAEDQLFSPTVLEDVAFGPLNMGKSPSEAVEIAREALADVGISALEERITYKLSGGEKKLAALASVLSMKPEILLLDEPVTGLDRDARKKIMDSISRLELTTLIVSHDWDFLEQMSDRVYVMENGKCLPAGQEPLLHRHAHLHPAGDVEHKHSDLSLDSL